MEFSLLAELRNSNYINFDIAKKRVHASAEQEYLVWSIIIDQVMFGYLLIKIISLAMIKDLSLIHISEPTRPY